MRPSRAAPLSLGERVALRVLDAISEAFLGFRPPVNEEAMRTLGVGGYMRWSGATARVMKALAKHFGEAEAQYVIGFSGLWLGCGYCGAGHIHAGNLIVFRDRGVLTPLDDAALRELYDTADAEAMLRLEQLLADPAYARVLALVRRLYALRAGATPEGPDDAHLVAALACWDWVTECTIVFGFDAAMEKIPPLTPLARDRKLLARYDAARGAKTGA